MNGDCCIGGALNISPTTFDDENNSKNKIIINNNNNKNNNNNTKKISFNSQSSNTKKLSKCSNTTCLNVFYLCISDIVGTPPCDMVQLDSMPMVTSYDDVINFPDNTRDMRMAYPFNYTFYKWSVSGY